MALDRGRGVGEDMSTPAGDALLHQPLKEVIGGKTAAALNKAFGMNTVLDLLEHYPRRYAERGQLTDLQTLSEGESVTIMATIDSVTVRQMKARRGSILEAVVTDGRGHISVTFFNQKWREREFRAGRSGLFAGQISTYRGKRQLAHPQCILLPEGVDDDPDAVAAFAGAVIPVYPSSASITSWQLGAAVTIILDSIGELSSTIPESVRQRFALLDYGQALRMIHRPSSMAEVEQARHTLKFGEALLLQCVLAQRRSVLAASNAIPRVHTDSGLLASFDSRLPFQLTSGQQEVAAQISKDLAADHPMHRLLQGDVGTGKTVVALRAMLAVVDAGGQAALLAPTEVLAQQHYRWISQALGPLGQAGTLHGDPSGTKVALLTGSQRSTSRRAELLDVASGQAGIVIGTHALLQDRVEFADLALVVVDEQHRFGVEQRAALSDKALDGTRPHTLVMTATPIPRTLAMTVFGDLEVSTLTELPAGRAPITTHVVAVEEQPAHAARVWQRASEEVALGRRVFVVCPRIGDEIDQADAPGDESQASPLASVLETFHELSTQLPNNVRLGMLHGRMSADEKESTMQRFADTGAQDGIDVLVATTVIEVGVDVPEASTMIVLDADRFGISQLHQLRGRVGRGGLPGLCLLCTRMPAGSPARQRLDAVASTTDGFALSQLDLELRQEGDVLGATQSGVRSSLRLLQVLKDAEVIEQARQCAQALIDADPQLVGEPILAEAVARSNDQRQSEYLEKA